MQDESDDRRADRSADPRDRRDSDRQKKEYPEDGIDDRRRPQERDQYAEQCRGALTAAKTEPHRVEVAEERAGGGVSARLLPEEQLRKNDCSRCLQAVEDQCQRRQHLASGPKHVGRPDIPGADFPHVPLPGEPCEDEAKRDRPEQISQRQGKDHLAGHLGVSSKRERRRNSSSPAFAGEGDHA